MRLALAALAPIVGRYVRRLLSKRCRQFFFFFFSFFFFSRSFFLLCAHGVSTKYMRPIRSSTAALPLPARPSGCHYSLSQPLLPRLPGRPMWGNHAGAIPGGFFFFFCLREFCQSRRPTWSLLKEKKRKEGKELRSARTRSRVPCTCETWTWALAPQ